MRVQSFVKEVLQTICVYNKRGPNKATWELKPEYRGADASSSSAAAAEAGAAGVGVDDGGPDEGDDDAGIGDDDVDEGAMAGDGGDGE